MGETLKPVVLNDNQSLPLTEKFNGVLPKEQLEIVEKVANTSGTVAAAAEARGMLDA